MTPQELKNSILQLAIQGKLVEQREEEGTVQSLLKTIPVLDSISGHRVKKKSISAITEDDKIFEIPDSWEWIRLGSVCTIARGGSPRPIKEYLTTDQDGVNWIKIGDTEKNGKYISSTAEKIRPNGVSKSRMVHAGDFLLTNSMSFGRPYILKIDGCIHDGWLVISQSSRVFDQDYLYWLLSSSYTYTQFCDKVSGAVVKNLNSEKVANSVFPLPPLAEQRRIVAKIEELLPYVDRYEKAWNRLEEFNKRFPVDMQKSILQMAIQGKLVEQRPEEGTGEELYQQIQAEKQKLIKAKKIKKGKPLPEITADEIPFEIPESWKWVRIDELFVVGTGMTPLKGEKLFYENGTVPWVTSTLTSNRYIRNTDTFVTQYALDNTSLTVYPPHTIIIAMYGQGKTRGQVSELLISATINQACAALGNIINEEVFVHYIYYYFEYNYELLRKKAEGTSQPNLNLSKIKEYAVPLPPLAEQKRIVERLEELLPLCERLK